MNLVVLPPPPQTPVPSLTVRALAKIMELPAHAQGPELRDQKYPRSGHGKQRVPYYQPAMLAVTRFLGQRDADVLRLAIAEIKAELVAPSGAMSDQAIARLRNNQRVLELCVDFPRLHAVTSGRPGSTLRITRSGIEVRSTPQLLVIAGGVEKRVFVHERRDDLDEDEARRILELAHWVEEEARGPRVPIADFEFWMLAERKVLSWRTRRKRTISRAERTMPIIAGAWEVIEAPPGWHRPEQARPPDPVSW